MNRMVLCPLYCCRHSGGAPTGRRSAPPDDRLRASPESRDVTSGFRVQPWGCPGMIVVGVLLLPRLRAEALFLFAQFGRQHLAEIVGIKDLPDFDFSSAVERRALHPRDRLIQRLGLDQQEAGDEIAGSAEGTIGKGALLAGIFDAGALLARMQALAVQHDA